MLIGKRHKEGFRKEQAAEKQFTNFKFPMNLELDRLPDRDINYEVNMEYDTLLLYYKGEIRIICLADMQVERVIENIHQQIHSVGVHLEGVYFITSDRRSYYLNFYDRE
jgi:hypothetical protein